MGRSLNLLEPGSSFVKWEWWSQFLPYAVIVRTWANTPKKAACPLYSNCLMNTCWVQDHKLPDKNTALQLNLPTPTHTGINTHSHAHMCVHPYTFTHMLHDPFWPKYLAVSPSLSLVSSSLCPSPVEIYSSLKSCPNASVFSYVLTLCPKPKLEPSSILWHNHFPVSLPPRMRCPHKTSFFPLWMHVGHCAWHVRAISSYLVMDWRSEWTLKRHFPYILSPPFPSQ